MPSKNETQDVLRGNGRFALIAPKTTLASLKERAKSNGINASAAVRFFLESAEFRKKFPLPGEAAANG